jgi:hypothetical protein
LQKKNIPFVQDEIPFTTSWYDSTPGTAGLLLCANFNDEFDLLKPDDKLILKVVIGNSDESKRQC